MKKIFLAFISVNNFPNMVIGAYSSKEAAYKHGRECYPYEDATDSDKLQIVEVYYYDEK